MGRLWTGMKGPLGAGGSGLVRERAKKGGGWFSGAGGCEERSAQPLGKGEDGRRLRRQEYGGRTVKVVGAGQSLK